MTELHAIVRLWERHRGPSALATLVRVTGSSYRRPGARMLVTSAGETVGRLSAGCIEDDVARHAHDVMHSGRAKLLTFDTRRRFGCNGAIEVFIEAVTDDFMMRIGENLAARTTFDIVTSFDADQAFRQTVEPPIRLLVFGDGNDALALAAQARFLGWDVTVLSAVTELQGDFDSRTATVIATHNFGRDCAALRHLLPLDLRYVGLIGPRRRREELLADVIDSGATITSDLFAPAGLHLAAETPEEIALSVVAEIQTVFAGGTAQHLCNRKAPIHTVSPVQCVASPR